MASDFGGWSACSKRDGLAEISVGMSSTDRAGHVAGLVNDAQGRPARLMPARSPPGLARKLASTQLP